jgi:hypothetical protein
VLAIPYVIVIGSLASILTQSLIAAPRTTAAVGKTSHAVPIATVVVSALVTAYSISVFDWESGEDGSANTIDAALAKRRWRLGGQ